MSASISPAKNAAGARGESQAPATGISADWLFPTCYFLVMLLGAAFWFRFQIKPNEIQATLGTMAIGVLCSSSCALLGCYLVLRRMSLIGDAISHAVLPGIAIAVLLTGQNYGVWMMVGAMVLGMLTSFLTQSLHSLGKVAEDASMGVVFTSLFALGVVLIGAFLNDAHIDLDCVLYGQIEFAWLRKTLIFGHYVPHAFALLIPAELLTVGFITLFWKELKIVSFDPALAAAMGIKVWVVHYLLMAMVAGVTVASFESVGSILVVAMLIVPAAGAGLMTDRLGKMLLWSVIFASLSAILGYLAAAALNTNVAGMMAVVAGVQFTGAVFLAPRHGLASRWLRNWALSVRIASEDILGQLYREEEAVTSATPVRRASTPSGFVGLLSRWRLWRQGLVQGRGGESKLTPTGRAAARNLVRAHRLWESFLEANFDLPPDHLHEPAERMEHFVGPELQEQLDAQLAGREIDPHGKKIPKSDPAA